MNDIERIKDAIDLVDVVGCYVTLERAGSNFRACCPFHQEKTPSFFVSAEKQYWHCYGACGEGGDVFSFLMKAENLEFYPALQRLAAQAGIELQSARKKPRVHPHAPLFQRMAQAAAFYRRQFVDSPEAQAARAYVAERGIAPEISDRFQLGYSSRRGQALLDFMRQQQVDPDSLVELGLLYRDQDTGRYSDRFRGRLMIPIQNRRGYVIGFGARILEGAPPNAPKYINSATTPLFQKKQVLFGIDKALDAIRKAQQAVLVEGYMDVITAHQHGFANTVACMGTAITPEQLDILRRYTPHIVFALDADASGQQATMRGLARARTAMHQGNRRTEAPNPRQRKRDLQLSIVTLPQGQDPDELIRTDAKAWQERLAQAASLVDFYVAYVSHQHDLARPEEKQAAVGLLAEVLAEIEQAVTRDEYIKRVARQLDTSAPILTGLVNERRARMQNPAARQAPRRQAPTPESRPQIPNIPSLRREDLLLGVLFKHPESVCLRMNSTLDQLGVPGIHVDDFHHAANRELFAALEAILLQGNAWDRDRFLESLAQPLAHHLQDVEKSAGSMMDNTRQEISYAALETLFQMRRESVDTQIGLVSMQSGSPTGVGDSAHRFSLYQERNRLDRAQKQLHMHRHTWADA